MQTRQVWLFGTALALLFAQSAVAKAELAPPGQVLVMTPPSLLPKGTKCRIVMQPEDPEKFPTTFTIYEGTIQDAAKNEVVLTEASFQVHATNTNALGRLPFLSRFFKNTGTARAEVEEKELRIPVDEIRSVWLIETANPAAVQETKTPPARVRAE
jgi:hypothetical protein